MKSFHDLKDIECYEAIIFFDLEYTCWSDNNVKNNWKDNSRPPELIQIGFAYYDKYKNEIVSTYTSYVRPQTNSKLSSYCKELLDIDQKLIDSAPFLKDAVDGLMQWLNNYSNQIIFISWGFEDYYILSEDCKRQRISNPLEGIYYLDLMRLSDKKIGLASKMFWDREKVKKYLKIHKKDHNHDALKDAIELKAIYQALKHKFYDQYLV